MAECKIIAVTNQKGGVGLANTGKSVLLVDGDPQGSLTVSLGQKKS